MPFWLSSDDITTFINVFNDISDNREQILFPFHFTGTLGRFDVECEVEAGGRTSQTGAHQASHGQGSLQLCGRADD